MLNYCKECGMKIEDSDQKFCQNCGKPLTHNVTIVKSESIKPLEKNTLDKTTTEVAYQVEQKEKVEEKKAITILKKYYYVFFLIGASLSLIALLTPASWFQRSYAGVPIEYSYYWMFGTQTYYWWQDGVSTYIWADIDSSVYYSSLFSALILAAVSIASIVLTAQMLKRKKEIAQKRIVACAILMVITPIVWVILMQIFYSQYMTDLNYWAVYQAGFGVIGPILGSILLIIGLCIKNMDTIKERILQR
jgi:hypothetical protein